MAKAAITEQYLTDIADAIRSKTGMSSATYYPSEMAPAIMTISGSGGITPTGTINITENGTHNVTTYASANVSVPNSYGSSDEGKVVSNGALVAQSSATYTENGTYDTTLKNSVTVDVESSGSGTEVVSVVDTTDTAGGTIRTITAVDISDTTATAADVASGKYFYDATGEKKTGTASGGGGNGYGGDGTWTRPNGWPRLDSMTITGGDVVYMSYIASEELGFCDLDIKRTSGSFTFEIGEISNGTFTADSSTTYSKNTRIKKYFGSSNGGFKVIRITGLISEITTYRNDWTTYDGVYRYSAFQGIVEIYGELPHLTKINFYSVGQLRAVRLGEAKLLTLETMFYNNFWLQNVDADNWDISSATTMYLAFGSCRSLMNVDVFGWDTSNVTNCRQAFYQTSVYDIDISSWDMSSVTTTQQMLHDTKFTEITIPASLTNIGTSMFGGDNQHLIYHFKRTTPPTLDNTNAFSGIRSQAIIYVPQGSLSDYQSASNWSTYASYMQEEPS